MSNKAKVCRICMLGNIKGVISLFTLCDGTVKIYNKVMEVANIQISREDGLPTWICYTCLIHLETSYQFKVQAEKSDQLFKKQLDTTNNEDMKKMAIYTNEDPLQNRSHLRELLIEPKPSDKSFVGSDSINQDYFTNIQSGLQGHFLSEVFDVNDCSPVINSEEQNGIKITSVVSQAKPEGIEIEDSLTNPELVDTSDNDTQVVGTPSKESVCTCTEDKDGINISKCDVCTKMSSNHKPTDELTESGENEPSCSNQTESLISVVNEDGNNSSTNGTIPSNSKSAELENEGHHQFSYSVLTPSFMKVVIQDYNLIAINNPEPIIQAVASNSKGMPQNVESFEENDLSKISRDKVLFVKNITIPRNRHKCKICNEGFKRFSHLQLHMQVHSDGSGPKSRGRYKCPICDEGFQFKTLLRVHIMSHNGIKPYKCNICQKTFLFEEHLTNHKILHTEDRPIKCDLCDRTFKHAIHLSSHMAHHSDQSRVCEHCGKFYKTYSGWHSHQQIHHWYNPKKSVKCEQCGKSFASIGILNKHTRRHEVEPVTCEICKKTYTNKYSLKVHRNTVHVSKMKHQCGVCKKIFKHKFTLQVHIDSKHSGKEKPKCGICNTTFSQKTSLRTHMKIIHSGLKPHTCKHCKQLFKWKQTCDKHELNCLKSESDSNEVNEPN